MGRKRAFIYPYLGPKLELHGLVPQNDTLPQHCKRIAYTNNDTPDAGTASGKKSVRAGSSSVYSKGFVLLGSGRLSGEAMRTLARWPGLLEVLAHEPDFCVDKPPQDQPP